MKKSLSSASAPRTVVCGSRTPGLCWRLCLNEEGSAMLFPAVAWIWLGPKTCKATQLGDIAIFIPVRGCGTISMGFLRGKSLNAVSWFTSPKWVGEETVSVVMMKIRHMDQDVFESVMLLYLGRFLGRRFRQIFVLLFRFRGLNYHTKALHMNITY